MTTLSSKTVLLTGSNGFIGGHIKELLLAEGAKVKEFDLNNGLDLCSKRDIQNVFNPLTKIEAVCHQAGSISVSESMNNPDTYIKNNFDCTLNLLEAARKCNVKNVVIASSSSVYGLLSPYAYSKYYVEQLAEMYNKIYGMNIICLRYFNVYGPKQKVETGAIIPNLITKIMKNQSPTVYGDGTQTRDFVYVKDVAKANLLALTTPIKESKCVLDVASGESVSILTLIDIINKQLNKNIKPEFQEVKKGDILHSKVHSLEATMNYLNWKPEFNIENGLKGAINYYLANTL
jgi:UDP-glucose 4-epimerase